MLLRLIAILALIALFWLAGPWSPDESGPAIPPRLEALDRPSETLPSADEAIQDEAPTRSPAISTGALKVDTNAPAPIASVDAQASLICQLIDLHGSPLAAHHLKLEARGAMWLEGSTLTTAKGSLELPFDPSTASVDVIDAFMIESQAPPAARRALAGENPGHSSVLTSAAGIFEVTELPERMSLIGAPASDAAWRRGPGAPDLGGGLRLDCRPHALLSRAGTG